MSARPLRPETPSLQEEKTNFFSQEGPEHNILKDIRLVFAKGGKWHFRFPTLPDSIMTKGLLQIRLRRVAFTVWPEPLQHCDLRGAVTC